MPLLDLLEKLHQLIGSAIAQLKTKHKQGDIIRFSGRKNASIYTLGYVIEVKEMLLVYTLVAGEIVEVPVSKALKNDYSPNRYAELTADIPEIYKRTKSD